MKRLHSFLLLTVLSCTLLGSCERTDSPSFVGEYSGYIQSTIMDDPYAYSGFYVVLDLYDDNTCVLTTAVILEDNYTLSNVRQQVFQYGHASETGFDIYNNSGLVVAKAVYSGSASNPKEIIDLSWEGLICPEWGHFAVPCGWELPCRMAYYTST
jgi:hypothetical protein